MSLPGNGIFVVRGEMSTLMTAMRRGTRWSSHLSAYVDENKDGLMKLFMDLKQELNRTKDLRSIEPDIFLAPFLEVIRTDETTGAVTSLALSAINKFLSYGLLDPTSKNLAVTVENIVDAVTNARFMVTDQSSDGVTLFHIVEVLHTIMRGPEGSVLTNEAVCEVVISCLRICFDQKYNELLRRSAEQALKDMVLLLFMRLPQFSEDSKDTGLSKKMQMMTAAIEKDNKHTTSKRIIRNQTSPVNDSELSQSFKSFELSGEEKEEERKFSTVSAPDKDFNSPFHTLADVSTSPEAIAVQLETLSSATALDFQAGKIIDLHGEMMQASVNGNEMKEDVVAVSNEQQSPETMNIGMSTTKSEENLEERSHSPLAPGTSTIANNEYINSVGVRFTQQNSLDNSDGLAPLLPYGLPCIQQCLRILITLCDPLDKQNTEPMMHMGLSLLTVAFEVGADNIGKYESLLQLVKDDLCRNLFALMNVERLSIFSADLQLCFLLFESLRGHLKFQLEAYMKKICEIIANDNPKTPYEMRELALDNLLQLWRLPGFVTELYINYDCALYCSDLFENITNLLSKYTLSATTAVYNTHIIAMDTLLSVVDSIESNCLPICDNSAINPTPLPSNRHSRHNSDLESIVIGDVNLPEDSKVENISKFINCAPRLRLPPTNNSTSQSITREYLAEIKRKKNTLRQGTELFNQKPQKGIQYLQDHGILKARLDPREVALFLRENPGLDKKMIGDYISVKKKKDDDPDILMNFVETFNFVGLRIDQALRLYLESFRLPGEAPLIFMVLEYFADHWHIVFYFDYVFMKKQNGEPFANNDAAFKLAYAVIMLNMDQHNLNAKRRNQPMTQEGFLKNLRGLNGKGDFNQDMLASIFNSIKNEEIVVPAEQTGLVRENYLWKVLLRRGVGPDGTFSYAQDSNYDMEIFKIIWGPSLSALSFMFDKSSDNGYQRTLTGFTKCAGISFYYDLHEDFDALVLTLCKFTTLLPSAQQEVTSPTFNEIVQAVNFGLNPKAQAAMRTVFALVHDYGDCLHESWRQILKLYLQLFRLKLLPKTLMEVEDFCEPSGKTQLILEKPAQKQESGLFSSLYSYLSSDGQREPSFEERECIKIAKKCIKECQLDQQSTFVHLKSLQELIKHVLAFLKAPSVHKSISLPYAEDVVVFWMEFLVKIVIYNRDRMIPFWTPVRDQMYLLLMGGASCSYDYLLGRGVVALLKLAIYLMCNEELCPSVLDSLKMLLMLKPAVILRISKQISIGMYELLKTSAHNIHTKQDWQIIFTLLECVGAGAEPPDIEDATLPIPNGFSAKSDGALSSEDDSGLPDRGYISDSEITNKQLVPKEKLQPNSNTSSPFPSSPTSENWILINKDTDLNALSRPQSPPTSSLNGSIPSLSGLVYNCKLSEHSPLALFKCWDTLAFIVRNVAHITPYNFESCVRCIRTFVEACRDGGFKQRYKNEAAAASGWQQKKRNSHKRQERSNERRHLTAQEFGNYDQRIDCEENDEIDLAQRYETLSIQLLDLMYTLYTRTAQIFRYWAEEGSEVPQFSGPRLWAQGWCPLLQGIARLATDRRREVRTYAISCLQQRALLVHDLQTLSGSEWASCFHQVLFPLLNELLPDSPAVAHLDCVLLEESRIRTATIMSKVFLHHLNPLIELGEVFNELWINILDYIEKFMQVGSDMLSEQMQEILKNMLLVMHSVRVFHNQDGSLHLALWQLTWKRIGDFLPNLKDELFHDEESNRTQVMAHIKNNINTALTSQKSTITSTAPTTATAAAMSKNLSNNSHNNNLTPSVIVLPQQNHQIAEQTSPLISPMESPRHSIILQPPSADLLQQPIILGQIPPNQLENMPFIVPYQETTISQTVNPELPSTSMAISNNRTELRSTTENDSTIPITTTTSTIRTNVSNRPTSSRAQGRSLPLSSTWIDNDMNNISTGNSLSFSIELPDTSTDLNDMNRNRRHSDANQRRRRANHESENDQNNIKHLVREHYNHCFQRYQQYQEQEQQKTQQQKEAVNTSSRLDTSTSLLNSSLLGGDEVLTLAESESEFMALQGVEEDVKLPLSHLTTSNAYPSLTKQPNPVIVHSFTPLFVPPSAAQSGTDIYEEYVQNPYNLTLQQTQLPEVSLVSVEQSHRETEQIVQQFEQRDRQQEQAPQSQAEQEQQDRRHPRPPAITRSQTPNILNYFANTI
uniref:SEC7 domain-containing protein n=1 Tax=Glossina pallidipes TaxID=7398 RepID=A0A1A9ZR77_GLOPL